MLVLHYHRICQLLFPRCFEVVNKNALRPPPSAFNRSPGELTPRGYPNQNSACTKFHCSMKTTRYSTHIVSMAWSRM